MRLLQCGSNFETSWLRSLPAEVFSRLQMFPEMLRKNAGRYLDNCKTWFLFKDDIYIYIVSLDVYM